MTEKEINQRFLSFNGRPALRRIPIALLHNPHCLSAKTIQTFDLIP